jgi:peptidoglycan/xylan/chitin deacetylase (PgdA/CDA1 family)
MTGTPLLRSMAKGTVRAAAAAIGPHRWPSRHPRLWILMYHRILPRDDPRTEAEEPGMIVTPETFRQHIGWLRPEFELIHLGEWVQRARQGKPLPPKACAITFDDGWRDNYEFAFPILEETGIPATVFAVSHMIGTEEVFWPNRLARILGAPEFHVTQSQALEWLRKLVPPTLTPPLDRDQRSAVISAAKVLPDHEISERLDRIEREIPLAPSAGRSLLDWDELRAMTQSGLVEVGSHTCHHARLNDSMSAEQTTHEILDSQRLLQEQLDCPIRLFCYPNGDVTARGLDLVRKHYDGAVTTRLGLNTPDTSLYQLMRTAIHEDISARWSAFFARLSGWL